MVKRARRGFELTLDYFRQRSEVVGECWVWQGAKNRCGYGRFRQGKVLRSVHRSVYQLVYGPIPADQDVCHHCDNPPCWRPEHLFAGTAQENAQDMVAKGRFVIGTRVRGESHHLAKLTEDQVKEMREMRSKHGWGARRLGKHFGVAYSTAQLVIDGKTWR